MATLPVAVIAGPTASGKSALAARLAADLPATLINADALQVYREVPILTAQPDPAELPVTPHRLYGVLGGAEPCSAGRWRTMAEAAIREAREEGRLPVVVGGTGLYIKALEEGIADIPPVPECIRRDAMKLYDELGGAAFRDRLAGRDPVAAARLHENDRQRLVRAWSVHEATGRPLSAWHRAGSTGTAERFRNIAVMPPREELYRRADERFRAMIESGALAEVETLLARGYPETLPVMKALGVRELAGYLRGEHGLEEAIAAACLATRRYAKRQYTWLRTQLLRNDPNALALVTQYNELLKEETFNKIRQFLLTASE